MKSILDAIMQLSKSIVIGTTVVLCTLLIVFGLILGCAIG